MFRKGSIEVHLPDKLTYGKTMQGTIHLTVKKPFQCKGITMQVESWRRPLTKDPTRRRIYNKSYHIQHDQWYTQTTDIPFSIPLPTLDQARGMLFGLGLENLPSFMQSDPEIGVRIAIRIPGLFTNIRTYIPISQKLIK